MELPLAPLLDVLTCPATAAGNDDSECEQAEPHCPPPPSVQLFLSRDVIHTRY